MNTQIEVLLRGALAYSMTCSRRREAPEIFLAMKYVDGALIYTGLH